jgi:hypothetical protein
MTIPIPISKTRADSYIVTTLRNLCEITNAMAVTSGKLENHNEHVFVVGQIKISMIRVPMKPDHLRTVATTE